MFKQLLLAAAVAAAVGCRPNFEQHLHDGADSSELAQHAVMEGQIAVSQNPYEQIIRNHQLVPITRESEVLHNSRQLEFRGWHAHEPTHVWSKSSPCSIDFSVGKWASVTNRFVLKGWALGAQRLILRLNNIEVWSGQLSGDFIALVVEFRPNTLNIGENRLEFELPDARTPDNGDPRVLGFAFASLKFD